MGRADLARLRIFSSAEYCFRMARRMFITIRSEDGFWFSDFCILLRLKVISGNRRLSTCATS